MITALFLILSGAIIAAFSDVMGKIFSWAFPDFINALVAQWVQGATQLNIFLPMIKNTEGGGLYQYVGIFDLISWFIGILLAIKGIELLLWLGQFIPWFNPPKTLPGKENTIDLGDPETPRSHRINLRNGRIRSRIIRNTRDVK